MNSVQILNAAFSQLLMFCSFGVGFPKSEGWVIHYMDCEIEANEWFHKISMTSGFRLGVEFDGKHIRPCLR